MENEESTSGGTNMAEEEKVAEVQPTESPAPSNEPVQLATVVAEGATPPAWPTKLASECVKSILAEAALPEPTTERLAEREYETEDALKAAIVAEVAYIKEVTGAGKVVGNGPSAAPEPVAPAARLEERQKKLDQIDERFGLRR
jgi:hypothetical protein